MTESEENPALETPAQHLDAPRFCAADAQMLASWASKLPRGNLGETSRQLYNALEELNHCRLDARLRFELQEVLRPLVFSVCGSLAVHYHNQPIVLPSQALQIYMLSQTIQIQLAMGYQIVARDTAQGRKPVLGGKNKRQTLMAQALHRAITDLGYTLYRGYLIYSEPDPAVWRQLHKLYRFAEHHELGDLQFKDMETGQVYPLSIEKCYLKALLLGSVRSNQLRQEDLKLVFDSLCEWVKLAQLGNYECAEEDHIVVNLDSDEPPIYQALFLEPAQTANCRILILDELLHHLGHQLAGGENGPLSHDLIKHLMISWSSYTRRTFMRMDTSDHLLVCVGMSSLHYFAANETELEDFTRGKTHNTFQLEDDDNPFLRKQARMKHEERDLWNIASRPQPGAANIAVESIDNHIRQFEMQASAARRPRSYENYRVSIVNVSAGGYALQWPLDNSARANNGDIVGVRESRHANWSVGIVSWIRRNGEEIAQLGIKLLSPSAVPYAARVMNRAKTGKHESSDDFRRVLLLPEIKLIGQPPTLLTPAMTFREKQTLQLVQQDRTLTVRLKKLICSTGAIKQFDIEVVDKPWQERYETNNRADRFDVLWDSL
jgi:hypothetical protein